MKHIMIDAYECQTSNTDNLLDVYESIVYIINKLHLEAIMPPQLVPYHFCENQNDRGISAFVLLKGGHFTIHTFPVYGCYFVDLLLDAPYVDNQLETCLMEWFPCKKANMYTKSVNRDEVESVDFFEYSGVQDFGPHYMFRVKMENRPTMDWMSDFLDKMPPKANMSPITRPCVLKSQIDDPEYLSGIILIAESHIALHYNVATKMLYMDVFSCKEVSSSFDSVIKEMLPSGYEQLLTRRGRRNEDRKITLAERATQHREWQQVIREKK